VPPPLSATCTADVTGALLPVLERVRELIGSLLKANEGLMLYFTDGEATFFWETKVYWSDIMLSASALLQTY
jgi:hypothetical protein